MRYATPKPQPITWPIMQLVGPNALDNPHPLEANRSSRTSLRLPHMSKYISEFKCELLVAEHKTNLKPWMDMG